MRAKSRRKIEMGQRVLEFIRQNPDLGPGFASATARLKERVARARQLAQQQLDGRSESPPRRRERGTSGARCSARISII